MTPSELQRPAEPMDESPWILPPASGWRPVLSDRTNSTLAMPCLLQASIKDTSSAFRILTETFPGNMAAFAAEGIVHDNRGVRLTLSNEGAHG